MKFSNDFSKEGNEQQFKLKGAPRIEWTGSETNKEKWCI
jgi:hypothetical protein